MAMENEKKITWEKFMDMNVQMKNSKGDIEK
jgi:hypothetical protein